MKELLLLVCVVFCNYSVALANLAHEKEYWVEEISKTGKLRQNMINKHFNYSLESLGENIFGGSESEMESWRKTTLVIAKIIKNNQANLEVLHIERLNHQKFNNFYINSFLDAVIDNKTIQTLVCDRAPANVALKVADIIKNNKTLTEMRFDDSDFDDNGALSIAKSLNLNNTLQTLSIANSSFSMSSRRALREAWSKNNVEGRNPKIEF